MAKSGVARRCGLLPAMLLFVVGQTWIILISLPNSPRKIEGDIRDTLSMQRFETARLGVLKDDIYTSHLHQTLQTILARHRGMVDTTSFNYNVSIGDTLSLRRPVPDNRNPQCHYTQFPYDPSLSVSVVTIFHNEALSTLLRTVHSIIDRSPPEVLREVILVDDASTLSYLKVDLDMYLSMVPKVRVIRNRRRAGLVRSRMVGAFNATGDVLVFFDAHMECNTRWLEPILHALTEERTAIVQPDVDIIKADTMEYFSYKDGERRSRGGFGWDLRYAWFEVPGFVELATKSKTEPFVTPVLVGNAIAVRRNHFFKIGGFDQGLDIWGGEHFDLSFKNWLCAGRVLTVPCSKVGHLFKLGVQSYSFGGDRNAVILKNLMRVAEVWLDEYKDVFYRVTLGRNKFLPEFDKSSIIMQKGLKKALHCKSFSWFLKNVLPEQKVPPTDAMFYGEITNVKTKACLVVLDDNVYIGMTYACFKYRIIPENSFKFSKHGEFMFDNQCIYIDSNNFYLRKGECDQIKDVLPGKWIFETSHPTSNTGSLRFQYSDNLHSLCASHVTGAIPEVHFKEQMVQGITCSNASTYQNWSFMYRLAEL